MSTLINLIILIALFNISSILGILWFGILIFAWGIAPKIIFKREYDDIIDNAGKYRH